jgi:hypothetical protein
MNRSDAAAVAPVPWAWRPTLAATMLMAALIVPQIGDGVYLGLDREPPQALNLLAAFWFAASLAAWFWSYCRLHRVPWLMDMGWFLLLAWFVIVPYYIVSRERWTGVGRIALFLLAIVAALVMRWLTANTVYALVPAE